MNEAAVSKAILAIKEMMDIEIEVTERRVVHGEAMITLTTEIGTQFFYNGAARKVYIMGGPRDGEDVTEAWYRSTGLK